MKDNAITSKDSYATPQEKRLMALSVSIALVLIVGIITGMMLAIHFGEPQAPPDSKEMEAIRTALARDPENDSARESLREEDLRLRKQYSVNRRRFQTGAWILLTSAVLAIACLKWFMSLDPEATRPSMPKDRQDVDQWAICKRRAWLLSCGGAGLFLIALLVMRIVGGIWLPPSVAREKWQGQSEDATNSLSATDLAYDDPPAYDENWPWFRGPTGMGLAAPDEWPVTWDSATGDNLVWRVKIPTPGNSSPVVWGGRVFLSGATEAKQELLCFDRITGQELWRATVAPSRPPGHEYEVMEETGYAAPSPATDGKRVYVMYASADIAAVDFDGKVVWERNLGLPDNFYGMATSLLIHDSKLLIQFDRGTSAEDNLSLIMALNTRTGKVIWSTRRPVDNGWSTPVLAYTAERVELVTSGDPWVIAYDPNTGSELWRARGLSDDVAPSPVYANGIVFVTNEYARTMAIRAGGSGDVTDTHILWTSEEGLSDAASSITNGEFLLQANSSGQMTCFGASTGEVLWTQNVQSEFWASPILAGDTVYLCGGDGKTYVFRLSREYSLLGTPDIGEPIYASPAFLDGQVFVRGMQHLFCIARQVDGK